MLASRPQDYSTLNDLRGLDPIPAPPRLTGVALHGSLLLVAWIWWLLMLRSAQQQLDDHARLAFLRPPAVVAPDLPQRVAVAGALRGPARPRAADVPRRAQAEDDAAAGVGSRDAGRDRSPEALPDASPHAKLQSAMVGAAQSLAFYLPKVCAALMLGGMALSSIVIGCSALPLLLCSINWALGFVQPGVQWATATKALSIPIAVLSLMALGTLFRRLLTGLRQNDRGAPLGRVPTPGPAAAEAGGPAVAVVQPGGALALRDGAAAAADAGPSDADARALLEGLYRRPAAARRPAVLRWGARALNGAAQWVVARLMHCMMTKEELEWEKFVKEEEQLLRDRTHLTEAFLQPDADDRIPENERLTPEEQRARGALTAEVMQADEELRRNRMALQQLYEMSERERGPPEAGDARA